MKNFLKNRSTTIIIKDYTMTERTISVDILQNSIFFFNIVFILQRESTEFI